MAAYFRHKIGQISYMTKETVRKTSKENAQKRSHLTRLKYAKRKDTLRIKHTKGEDTEQKKHEKEYT